MHPRSYEALAASHLEDLRRDAAGEQRLARATVRRRRLDQFGRVRGWLDRLGSGRRADTRNVARPRGDLRPSRGPELGQDVFDVAAGRLGRDPQ